MKGPLIGPRGTLQIRDGVKRRGQGFNEDIHSLVTIKEMSRMVCLWAAPQRVNIHMALFKHLTSDLSL